MPFTLRALEDEKKAKLGIKECVEHKLIEAFNVLHEKEEEIVAQFKYTLLLTANGPVKITGIPFDTSLFQSEHKITDKDLLELLATDLKPKKKKGGEDKKKEAVKPED